MNEESSMATFLSSFLESPLNQIAVIAIVISLLSLTTKACTVDPGKKHEIKTKSKTKLSKEKSDEPSSSLSGKEVNQMLPSSSSNNECAAPKSDVGVCSASTTTTVDFSVLPKISHVSHNGRVRLSYDESPLVIGNTKNPTHLVTLVHGLGDSANGWRQPAQMLASALPHVLFVLPTAPQQPVTVAGGSAMSSWFDVIEGSHGRTVEQLAARKTDVAGVLASGKYVAHIAGHIAFKHNIPTRNIIFGGFSQGGAMSIIAALTAPYVPRAVMPLSGFFPAAKEAIAIAKESGQIDALVANKVPFRFFHGDSDQMLPLGLARLGADALKAEGLSSIEFQVYKGLPHRTTSEELRDIASWLKTITL